MGNNNQSDADRQNTDGWVNDRLTALRPDYEWKPDRSRAFARLQERREARSGHRRRWAWSITGLVAAGLPLMALPVTRAITQRCVSACVEGSSRLREFFLGAAPSPAYRTLEEREVASDFAMTDSSGKSVRLSDFRGKVVLLNFWATWCEPCRIEIPMLKGLQQTYQDRGFTVLGVSLEEEGWNVVKPYMERIQFNYPVAVGGENIAGLYGGLDSVPATLLLDRSGRIVVTHVGLCSRSEYEADINAVLRER